MWRSEAISCNSFSFFSSFFLFSPFLPIPLLSLPLYFSRASGAMPRWSPFGPELIALFFCAYLLCAQLSTLSSDLRPSLSPFISSSSSSPTAAAAAAASTVLGHKHARSSSDEESGSSADVPSKESRTDTVAQPSKPHLYTHALESIFAFLTLRELSTVLAVSHHWSGAVGSMRSIDAACSRCGGFPILTVRAMCGSCSLCRHIASLGVCGREAKIHQPVETMKRVASSMIRLRSLHCGLVPTLKSIAFLSRLTHLWISITTGQGQEADAAATHATLVSVTRSLPQLQSFGLGLPYFNPLQRFHALHGLRQLTDLQLSWPYGEEIRLSADQANDLRTGSCARVQSFEIDDLGSSPELQQSLLRSPHDLQWQRLRGRGGCFQLRDAASCALVGSLRFLTQLSFVYSYRVDSSFLLQLVHLTDLTIDFENEPNAEENGENEPQMEAQGRYLQGRRLLLQALQECKPITSLCLDFCTFNSRQMCALLPALPSLQRLHLRSTPRLDSLRCFGAGSICNTLTHLTLWGDRQLAASECVHLHALRALTHLKLTSCFVDPLPPHERSLFEPPSALMPRLAELTCSH